MEDAPGSTILGFPANRVVAILAPLNSIIGGAASNWLWTHFPGLHVFGTQNSGAVTIGKAVAFAVGAGVTYAVHHKWLDGWQKWESSPATGVDGPLPGALAGGSSEAPQPSVYFGSAVRAGVDDEAELPTDEEEFSRAVPSGEDQGPESRVRPADPDAP
jgi:hypothetical protein